MEWAIIQVCMDFLLEYQQVADPCLEQKRLWSFHGEGNELFLKASITI